MSGYIVGFTCPHAETETAHAGDGGAVEVDLYDLEQVQFYTRSDVTVTCPTCGRTFDTSIDDG